MKIFCKFGLFLTISIFTFIFFAPRVFAYDDIKVDEITVSPPAPIVNQYCQITVKIKNIGTRSLFTSTGFSTFSYKFFGFQQSNLEYKSPSQEQMLDKDGYMTYIFSGKFTQATTSALSFTINKTEELAEEKIGDGGFTVKLYDDDTLAKAVTIYDASKADLSVESITLDRDFPIVGEPFNIIVTVKNVGPTSVTSDDMMSKENIRAVYSDYNLSAMTYQKSVRSAFCKNAVLLSSCNTYASFDDPLPSGQTIVYTYNGNYTKLGPQSFSFTVNANSAAPEASRSNNSTSTKFVVYGSETDVDNVAVSGITVTNISSTSVNIKWHTDRKTVGQVFLRRKNFYAPDEPSAVTDFTPDHSVDLAGLIPATKHWFQVKATALNTPKYSDWQEITTLSVDPATSTPTAAVPVSNNTNATPPAVQPAASAAAPAVTAAGTGAVKPYQIKNSAMLKNLRGKIILKVESKGEAYYINPKDGMMYFLGRPDDAFAVMRLLGVGIANKNLNLLPIGFTKPAGLDSDQDGLTDMLEDAIGTDKLKADTDGDSHDDKTELSQGFNPVGVGKMKADITLANLNLGKIFLEVENKGEAWYINPADAKRYFLGRPADAFAVMRQLGVGISNKDFNNL